MLPTQKRLDYLNRVVGNVYLEIYIYTNEIKTFNSISEAGVWLGYGCSLPFTDRRINGDRVPLLLKRTWEFKLAEDDSDWYYKPGVPLKLDSHGPYEVMNFETKKVEEFNTLYEIADYLNVKVGRVYTANGTNGTRLLEKHLIRPKSSNPWVSNPRGEWITVKNL